LSRGICSSAKTVSKTIIRRIKMADVAKAAGVSAMTVSRALKRDASIAPATRRRIQKVVAQLGYVPDRLAGSFSSQRSGFIGVMVPSLNNPHFAETAAGLQDALADAGLQLLLGHTGYRAAHAERLIETMLERRPEAMIVTSDDHTERTRALLQGSGIPVVEIWERPAKPIGHVVGFSNRQAAAEMTRHLIDIGRRRIGYIGEADDAGTRGSERRKGFVDAMKAAGLDIRRRTATVPPPINMAQGRAAMDALLTRWPDTDAVMCVSDPAAFGALTACQLSGRRVPRDVAIAGFGDFEISRCSLPAISTVMVDGHSIGRKAGALVRDLLSVGATDPQLITVPAIATPRGSTVAAS
jgi:LacI family transcriptional regulator, gluconate utilization system Gnt-I transcriptional repressor